MPWKIDKYSDGPVLHDRGSSKGTIEEICLCTFPLRHTRFKARQSSTIVQYIRRGPMFQRDLFTRRALPLRSHSLHRYHISLFDISSRCHTLKRACYFHIWKFSSSSSLPHHLKIHSRPAQATSFHDEHLIMPSSSLTRALYSGCSRILAATFPVGCYHTQAEDRSSTYLQLRSSNIKKPHQLTPKRNPLHKSKSMTRTIHQQSQSKIPPSNFTISSTIYPRANETSATELGSEQVCTKHLSPSNPP